MGYVDFPMFKGSHTVEVLNAKSEIAQGITPDTRWASAVKRRERLRQFTLSLFVRSGVPADILIPIRGTNRDYQVRRFAVAKGNVIVSQSGGPTAVINNSLVGVVHEALAQEKVGEVYGACMGFAGADENLIDMRREARRRWSVSA